MKRRQRSLRRNQRGVLLIALVALLVVGGLYFFISNLSPELMQARRQQQTSEALTQAREALIGYAVRFRETQQAQTPPQTVVYGYLPLPDLGNTRNQNVGCTEEGCDAANFAGNAVNVTVIGRFPWRTLGTGPLRDSDGECLWYAVSGSHQRIQPDPTRPMNWDTLSQLDVVVANSTAAMVSAVASAHERPIAVIFSPGPLLPGQDRSASVTDNVTECGGNYVVSNYLDPADGTSLGGITNFLAGTNGASGDTSVTNKALSANSNVNRRSDATLWAGNCPPNDTSPCAIVANDTGVAVTSDLLFRTLRGSSYFRTDINAMLDRMAECRRDQVAAGAAPPPDALTGFTPPADKTVGRIPNDPCYNDTQNPLGYFTHYRDQVFVAARVASDFTVTDTKNTTTTADDTTTTTCAGVLVFANQRGSGQLRSTTAERNIPANYLEGTNLTSFITAGALSFSGPAQFAQVLTSAAGGQTVNQDIVRCIPAGASLSLVAPVVAAPAGNIQLANYDPGTRTLTLGSADDNSNYGAGSSQLFACAWTPEVQAAGSGFRSYFRFHIKRLGEGFTFAVIDGDRNAANVCGAARQHLGYSGDNGVSPYIQWPKLAIEFDTARNTVSGNPAFAESGSPPDSLGRNDPCYLSSCGAAQNLESNAHVAAVYWGYAAANAAAPVVSQPLQDDNVHGHPIPPDASARPAPRNPAAVMPYPTPAPDPAPGVVPLDRMAGTDAARREFHARLELVRSFTAPADAKDGLTTVQVKLWIEPHTAASISAMSYNAGAPPTFSVTTSTAHNLATGDTVVIKDAVPTGYNGEYVITKIDATNFTAALPIGTTNPGPYISSIFWFNISGSPDRATVTAANHGLTDGNVVTISGAIPTEYNGNQTITRIDANSYYFDLELDYEPGDLFPAIAAAKALTPRAIKLANTTRPMSELDATDKAFLIDTATIYDEQMAACAVGPPRCPTGQSCGSDDMCYRPSFRNLRLGFTTAERPTTTTNTARGQLIEIRDRATTWLP